MLEVGGKITAVAVQSDAKIIAVGTLHAGKCCSCIGAIRLSAVGDPDKGFADDGVFALPFSQGPFGGHGIAIQEDGKVVIVGRRMLPPALQITSLGKATRATNDKQLLTSPI